MTTTAIPRMLRLPEVVRLTGYGRDTIYRLSARGQFPKPRKLGARASAWREDAVRAWIDSREEAQLNPDGYQPRPRKPSPTHQQQREAAQPPSVQVIGRRRNSPQAQAEQARTPAER